MNEKQKDSKSSGMDLITSSIVNYIHPVHNNIIFIELISCSFDLQDLLYLLYLITVLGQYWLVLSGTG